MSLFDDVVGDDFQEESFGPQEGFAGVLLCFVSLRWSHFRRRGTGTDDEA